MGKKKKEVDHPIKKKGGMRPEGVGEKEAQHTTDKKKRRLIQPPRL